MTASIVARRSASDDTRSTTLSRRLMIRLKGSSGGVMSPLLVQRGRIDAHRRPGRGYGRLQIELVVVGGQETHRRGVPARRRDPGHLKLVPRCVHEPRLAGAATR